MIDHILNVFICCHIGLAVIRGTGLFCRNTFIISCGILVVSGCILNLRPVSGRAPVIRGTTKVQFDNLHRFFLSGTACVFRARHKPPSSKQAEDRPQKNFLFFPHHFLQIQLIIVFSDMMIENLYQHNYSIRSGTDFPAGQIFKPSFFLKPEMKYYGLYNIQQLYI